eukprot:PhF_6_TR4227/c0_g1_i3/m.5715
MDLCPCRNLTQSRPVLPDIVWVRISDFIPYNSSAYGILKCVNRSVNNCLVASWPNRFDRQKEYLKESIRSYRLNGNEWFKKRDWQQALARYSCAIHLAESVINNAKRFNAPVDDELLDLLGHARSNQAQCYLNLELYSDAYDSAFLAIELRPLDVRAKYRAGMAAYHLRHYDRAHNLLTQCVEMDPGCSNEVRPLLSQIFWR